MIQGPVKQNIDEEIVRTVKNCPTKYDDSKRVLLIDADSIMYTSTYFPEESLLEFPTEEEQLEEAKYRTRTKLQEIQNNVEEWYNIVQTYIFIGGKGNFRYKVFPEYKANRKDVVKSPLLPFIKEYMIEELKAIESHGGEADDYIIDGISECSGNCVVSSIDKDVLYHSPNIPLYDYRGYNDVLGEFKSISTKESRLARATQLVTGDSTDGVPGAKGVGKAWCDKNMHVDMTDYQFIKAIFLAYLKANKNDSIESKKQIKLYYKVLKLHTRKEIDKLI
jgi:5'-3' exonuclease